ncbi:MAG: glycosyltransferase family 2 protein [Spirochaetes bacterium]|nr:glycosyltransferase family 2 protein [Spirochaetota bacterium]
MNFDINKPYVSIIIPCRNEENYIIKSLESVINQDYPKDKLEILIIDGVSTDNTKNIVIQFSKNYNFIKVLDNEKKFKSFALNIGIKNSKGDIIIIIDAHTTYKSDYISKCVNLLNSNHIDNVGGISITLPSKDTVIANAISIVLSNPFGVGNSYFRIGIKKPTLVDTVPYGCYKREVFDKIGYFNENLIRNQDIEFNLRLKKNGGRILLTPDIVSYYYARPDLKSFFNQNYLNGFWIFYGMKYAKFPFSIRHLIPLSFILSIIFTLFISLFSDYSFYLFIFILSLYFIFICFFSLKIILKHNIKYLIPIIFSFITLHISYGLGSFVGLVKLLYSKVAKNV